MSLSRVNMIRTFLRLTGRLVENDVRSAHNLCSEFLEWSTPLLDLSLESGVLLGGIGEMDGATVVFQNLALGIVCHINVANVLSPT